MKPIQKATLVIAFLIASAVFLKILTPYLLALFWAGILANILYPLFKRISDKVRSESIGAFIAIVIVLLVIVIPAVAVSGAIVKEAVSVFNSLDSQETATQIKTIFNQATDWPVIGELTKRVDVEEKFRQISGTVASIGLKWFKSLTQNTGILVLNLSITLFALYYFLKDGKRLLFYLMRLLPLGDDIEKSLYQKFVSTSRATLKGTILLGTMQGILGGVTIFIVGVPSVFLWTLVMIILSIIPAVGAVIVLLPIAVYMVFFGSVWQVVVLVLGMIVVGLLDNLLRPSLVGNDLKMHPLVVFLSTIGGLGLFGISGIVIGPIVAALLISILDVYDKRFKPSEG